MDIVKLKGIYVEGYGTIAKVVMQDKNLHVIAKAIYAYMNSFAGATNECFPTRSKMAYDLGINVKTITKYLGQLVENRYIKVEQQKENGRFTRNIYTILVSKNNDDEIDNQQNTVDQIADDQTLDYHQIPLNNNSLDKNNSYNNIYVQNSAVDDTAKQAVMLNFERFYSAYPKKKKRAKVLSWFLKHQPSCELVDKMLEAVKQQSFTIDWQKANGKYIPHPCSWLSAEAWENEIDPSEIADISEKSTSWLLAIELFERLRRQQYEKSTGNEKLIKPWAVVIDEYLSLERTKEREDRIFYAIQQATTLDYWQNRIVDAESLIKNINFIK